MERSEKISFVVPFNKKGELKTPQNLVEVDAFPSDIEFKILIGFIELRPSKEYKLTINVFPDHIRIKAGDELDLGSHYTSDILNMNIKTKLLEKDDPISATIDIDIDKISVVANGSYMISATLYEGDESLHTQNAFFFAKLK